MNKYIGVFITFCLLQLSLYDSNSIMAQNAVTPGEFIVEQPTLNNLGFEWKIEGDKNRNSSVTIKYRRVGAESWKQGMPLLRLGGERVFRLPEDVDYTVEDMFSGSILDLDPNTEYECRFTMSDPDGINGNAVKTVTVKTRDYPKPYIGGRILHVYPDNWQGEKEEPSFTTLQGAYYGSGTGDWSIVREHTVKPGDIIEIHAGLYEGDRTKYVNPEGITFEGTYYLTAKGTKEKPIVIRSAGDGEVIFDGAGAHVLFDVSATNHTIFEGITFRNADRAFYAGNKNMIGASNLSIINCRFENVGEGIITEYAGSKNFYISDNVLIGRDDRYRLLGWANSRSLYGENKMYSYIAIKVAGAGHVIKNNAISYFHDGIDVSTYGTPEKDPSKRSVSIDIINNDIHLMADDFIEADGGVHNIRVMRNRGVNSAQCGLSAQPIFGGPAYFIRNIIYNIPTGCALKFMSKPAGLIVYHNTFVSENTNSQTFSNAHFRNNLFLGTEVPNRPVVVFPFATSYSTSDYNGYYPNPDTEDNYKFVSPPDDKIRDYSISVQNNGQGFRTIEDLRKGTELEKNGLELDYEIFESLQPPQKTVSGKVYHAVDLNFQLDPEGKAVDTGVIIPNVNDDFNGKAPDMGALEVGGSEIIFGPEKMDRTIPFYR